MATRNGSAEWKGNLADGSGTVTVGDGVFTGAFTFKSRFEEGEGTNPEELLAAAHAACFSMALGNILSQQGNVPESIRTTARVQLRRIDDKPTIAEVRLETEGRVPGIDEAAFRAAAEQAKEGCVVSRALAGVPEMSVSATLVS
jgi:osmotically inducible protein OsmC